MKHQTNDLPNNLDEVLHVSNALDGADGVPRLGPEHHAQQRIHTALQPRSALPWEPAPYALRQRVLDAIESSPRTPALRFQPSHWPFAAAACLALAAGLAWVSLRDGPVAPVSLPAVSEISAPRGPLLDFRPLASLPEKTGSAVKAAVQAPLIHEARAIQEDARRGYELVLARLPLSSTPPRPSSDPATGR